MSPLRSEHRRSAPSSLRNRTDFLLESLEQRTLCSAAHAAASRADSVTLRFEIDPTDVRVGQAIPTVTVFAVSSDGLYLSDDPATVTLALHGPAGAQLSGTARVPFNQAGSNVRADFSDLSINLPGQYTLTARDGLDGSTTSRPFTVVPASTPATATTLSVWPSQQSVATDEAATVTVQIGGSGVGVPSGEIVFADAANPTGAIYGESALTADGVATMSDLQFNAGVQHLVAEYAGDDVFQASSTPFTVDVGGPIGSPIPYSPLSARITRSTLPAETVAGTVVRGTTVVNVTNLTTQPVPGPFTLQLFATLDGGFFSTQPIAAVTRPGRLLPGKAVSVRIPVRWTASGVGTHTLLVQLATAGSDATQTNVTGAPLTVVAQQSTLTPTILRTVPATAATDGSHGAALVSVVNTGDSPYVGPLTLKLYAQSANGGGATLLRTQVRPRVKLRADAGVRIRIRLRPLPADASPGFDLLVTTADSAGTITPSDPFTPVTATDRIAAGSGS